MPYFNTLFKCIGKFLMYFPLKSLFLLHGGSIYLIGNSKLYLLSHCCTIYISEISMHALQTEYGHLYEQLGLLMVCYKSKLEIVPYITQINYFVQT